MAYFKWFLFLLIGVPFELFAKVISPILACFVQEDGYLPKWLYWFQTPDNSCDGDRKHRLRWPRDGVFWTWARRCAWLFRNSAYGFNYYVLGLHYEKGDLWLVQRRPCGWRFEWCKRLVPMVLGARWQADRLADLLRQALPDFRPLEVHQSWGRVEDLG